MYLCSSWRNRREALENYFGDDEKLKKWIKEKKLDSVFEKGVISKNNSI